MQLNIAALIFVLRTNLAAQYAPTPKHIAALIFVLRTNLAAHMLRHCSKFQLQLAASLLICAYICLAFAYELATQSKLCFSNSSANLRTYLQQSCKSLLTNGAIAPPARHRGYAHMPRPTPNRRGKAPTIRHCSAKQRSCLADKHLLTNICYANILQQISA